MEMREDANPGRASCSCSTGGIKRAPGYTRGTRYLRLCCRRIEQDCRGARISEDGSLSLSSPNRRQCKGHFRPPVSLEPRKARRGSRISVGKPRPPHFKGVQVILPSRRARFRRKRASSIARFQPPRSIHVHTIRYLPYISRISHCGSSAPIATHILAGPFLNFTRSCRTRMRLRLAPAGNPPLNALRAQSVQPVGAPHLLVRTQGCRLITNNTKNPAMMRLRLLTPQSAPCSSRPHGGPGRETKSRALSATNSAQNKRCSHRSPLRESAPPSSIPASLVSIVPHRCPCASFGHTVSHRIGSAPPNAVA